MKLFTLIFNTLFILLLLGVAGLFLVPLLPIENNISIKIVESGSMEPAIKTGALVVVTPSAQYRVGEIITFKSPTADVPTTHRIVDVSETEGKRFYATKGDANEEMDNDAVPERAIIGKVFFDVPYTGFVLDFARQPVGFSLLIVLPALLIILGEIEKIWREVRPRMRRDKNDDGPHVHEEKDKEEEEPRMREIVRMIEIGHPILLYESLPRVRHLTVLPYRVKERQGISFQEMATGVGVMIFSFCFASLGFIGSTISYFNDTETSEVNVLTAQELDFALDADGSVYSFLGSELDDEDGALITITTPSSGSTPIKYEVEAQLIGNSSLFCESILVNAGSPFVYDGPLINLSGSGVLFDGPWVLALSLPDEYGPFDEGETCNVEIIYTAWDQNSEVGVGYSDEERVSLVFVAPESLPEALLIEPFALMESFVVSSTTEETPEEENEETVEEPTEVPEEEPVEVVEEVPEVAEEVTEEVPEEVEEVEEETEEVVEEPALSEEGAGEGV